MDFVVATLFGALCVVLLLRLLRQRDIVDYLLGVVAAFSIGYFCLPVWFEDKSGLNRYTGNEVAVALSIFLLFLLLVVVGTWLGRRVVPETIGFATPNLDGILGRWRGRLAVLSFGWYCYYFSTQDLTSYTSEDREIYLSPGGGLSAVTASISDLALAWIAISAAMALRERRRLEGAIYVVMVTICATMLIFVGQRLAFLTPIVMLMAFLALTEQPRKANQLLALGIIALAVISPVAVAVREAPPSVPARATVENFDYGASPVDTMFQSIIDRGDLIYVTINMKQRIETDPAPRGNYYLSVLANPIPSTFYPGGSKPYPLSTNGEPSGELSIYAWDSLQGGGTGSLTAFGGLVAYRELGWGGVLLNGFATGILFVFLARWLGKGGLLPMAMFGQLFVALAVRKVPPSFWEAMLALMPMLPILLCAFLLERLITPTQVAAEPGRVRTNSHR